MILLKKTITMMRRNLLSAPPEHFFSTFRILNKHVKNIYEEDPDLNTDKEFQSIVEEYFLIGKPQNCFVIQPYIKWGQQKLTDITPAEQLEEAVALVNTLKNWSVVSTLSVPLESFDKNTLFKSGNFHKVKDMVKSDPNITAVFINLSRLKRPQINTLTEEFGVLILDRYRIVMQILKSYATTKHAKLQVAMAELYFMQKAMSTEGVFSTSNPESLKLMMKTREQKLKKAIKELRLQRELLRNKRRDYGFPVVAMVGYTNAGKTSLIKALTGESSLMPKDQLFATLDVTLHQGTLSSGLQVLYVDTVGFISDIPTNLIECFVSTLEDAILADVILHVEDVSSSSFSYKRKHVLTTLRKMANELGYPDIMSKMISVGNKCDLNLTSTDEDLLLVSSKTKIGLDVLRLQIEKAVIRNTNRRVVTIKLLSGGDEMRWLRKNATVISETAHSEDKQYVNAKLIITESNLQKLRHKFI